ncbi:MAG: hypothetical protein ABI417_03895 [Coleofasciculaceae cyanobacterium]
MLRNITSWLKAKQHLRNNRHLKGFFVTQLHRNSVLVSADFSSEENLLKAARADPIVTACGKLG